jgi:hypothetical protein
LSGSVGGTSTPSKERSHINLDVSGTRPLFGAPAAY